MNDAQISQIEVSMEEARKIIDRGEMMERLIKIPDFDKLIHEHYFKEEASRLVLLRAHPGYQDEESQRDINNSIDAIGHFRQFLIHVRMEAEQARKALESAQDELAYVQSEESDVA
jgi:hypothetical protein